MLMRLDDIISNAKRIVGNRANADIYRTKEALSSLGNNIRGAVGGAADNLYYQLAKVAPEKGVAGSYADSPLDYEGWRTINILEEQGVSPELVNYISYRARQAPQYVPHGGSFSGDAALTHFGQLDRDSYNAFLNASAQAAAEAKAGQYYYDPQTQAMMAQNAKVKERAADEAAFVSKQQAALGRFLENYNPDQVIVNDELVRRRSRPSYPVQQDASWMNRPGRSWV